MQGEDILIRAFRGVPLTRKVWDIGERVVYATDAKGLERLSAGLSAPPPIGFPKEDVFKFDERLYKRLQGAIKRHDTLNLSGIWSEAKPYLEE
ncbi:MAG: hypothetical protein ACR2G4_15670 [Pyrinomonadaceae bacterium]